MLANKRAAADERPQHERNDYHIVELANDGKKVGDEVKPRDESKYSFGGLIIK